MRIVYLPVDERFCTRDYFSLLANSFQLDVKTVPKKILGKQKIPADVSAIHDWLKKTIQKDDFLILSLDMLLYGGLIPSRTDNLTEKTVTNRLENLKEFSKLAKRVYLTTTIMRIPRYNSDDEEPVYWEYYGEKIHALTKKMAIDLKNRGEIEADEITPGFYCDFLNSHFESDIQSNPECFLRDFFSRRERNAGIISKTLNLVKENNDYFLNITLDDNGKNSLNMYEATIHNNKIRHLSIEHQCSVHPGADESALTLLARALCDHFQYTPKIKIKYMYPEKKTLIPPYEGDALDVTIKNHIHASGGEVSEHSNTQLLVNNMDQDVWIESPSQNTYCSTKPYIDFLSAINTKDKIYGIADVKYPNGSDISLVKALLNKKPDWKNVCYSGWNTPSNTIGTTVSLTILLELSKSGYLELDYKQLEKYQRILLLENYAYQSIVRQNVIALMKQRSIMKKDLIPIEQEAEEYVKKELTKFAKQFAEHFQNNFEIKVYFPWHRPFEIGILEK